MINYYLIGWTSFSFFSLPLRSCSTCTAFISNNSIVHRTTAQQVPPSSSLLNVQSALEKDGNAATPSHISPFPPLGKQQRSTLTLLEHINLNVPDHNYILDFYLHILGMGIDPRHAIPKNVANGCGMVWANCGATQFHLVFGEEAQVVSGRIGLSYDDLEGLKDRLKRYEQGAGEGECGEGKTERPFESYSIDVDDHSKSECVRIVDRYGNVFCCSRHSSDNDGWDDDELIRAVRQPLLTSADVQNNSNNYRSSSVLREFAMQETTTDCRAIQYVEFHVPPNTAAQIADFYSGVFGAPTDIVTVPSPRNDDHDPDNNPASSSSYTSDKNDNPTNIAIIGIGSIDPTTGKTSQSLLFRETSLPIPPYDGHHIALYVPDFSAAFNSCVDAGVVWVNPRYMDKAMTLNGAKRWKQFRFKDILDLETGRVVFELEHEVRSVEHGGWTGLVGRK